MASFAATVCDVALLELVQDDRVARRLPKNEGATQEELAWLTHVSAYVWKRVSSLADTRPHIRRVHRQQVVPRHGVAVVVSSRGCVSEGGRVCHGWRARGPRCSEPSACSRWATATTPFVMAPSESVMPIGAPTLSSRATARRRRFGGAIGIVSRR